MQKLRTKIKLLPKQDHCRPGRKLANALEQNAQRLLDDAELLRKSRRYPSAAALAVLSLEEAGKLALLGGLFDLKPPTDRKDLRSHKGKQAAAARTVIWSMVNHDIDVILDSVGMQRGSAPIYKSRPKTETHTLEGLFARVNVKDFDAHAALRLRDRHQYRPIVQLAKGQFEEVKRTALYVDVGPSDDAVTVPSQITADNADRLIRLGRRALSLIRWENKRRAKVAAHWRGDHLMHEERGTTVSPEHRKNIVER